MKLNKFNQPTDSIASRVRPMSGIDFEAAFPEVRTKDVHASNLSVANLFSNSGTVSVSGGPFTDGQSLLITTTLSPQAGYKTEKNLGVPMVSCYQGTAVDSNYQIWPRAGGSITSGDYSFYSGFDYTSSTDQNLVYMIAVNNLSAGTQNITVVGRWRYLQEGKFASDNS